MNKFTFGFLKSSLIGTSLLILVGAFACVLALGWGASVQLKHTIAANAELMNIDSSALNELEHLRNFAESEVTNARAYFLLGSKSVLDKQKSDRQHVIDGLVALQKPEVSPQIRDIAKSLEGLEQQVQDIFDQAAAFRDKLTESKIVAQFYHSKTNPLMPQFNDKFDAIAKFEKAEIEQKQNRARQAGLDAQTQIPKYMTLFIGALSAIFFCAALLVIRLLFVRSSQIRERDRLLAEAKNAVLARDEVIAAVSQDFKEPLLALDEIAKNLHTARTSDELAKNAELIQGIVVECDGIVSDILDQKKSDMGQLALRLEQMAVADVLDEAQLMMQPLARERDITLQFNSVNQSVLAYVDRERVLRVLVNLVGNAIKLSPKRSRVQVKVKSDAQFATISVLDSGPIIPETRLSSIFENFWQARSSADQGPGVGLAVVKTIIEAHGGAVRAENSLVGEGNVFSFSLPRRRPAGAQLKKPTSSGVRRIAREQAPSENPDGPAL